MQGKITAWNSIREIHSTENRGTGARFDLRFGSGRSQRKSCYPQLHLVPWRRRARIHAGARLAGQRARYIEQQLISFAERTRDSPFARQYMWGAAASLSPQGVHDLAIYFSQLPARAANDGDRGLIARGEAIYQRGIPEANIAACVACHGPNAEGVGEIPRLGGLAYTYLKRRLDQWGQGYHGALALPMPHIASQLSRNQIEELASYLSFLR
jgi:cytochrome c553